MIQWMTHSSHAIKDFPMGDAHVRQFPVYLPPHYDAKRADPYPVVFMLAGFSSRGSKYIADDSVFQVPLQTLFDRAIINGELPPIIIVFPDGTSKLGCSQYINSPALGNYMDYICDELTQFIDAHFHTYRNAAYRGIAGHSSGGFGALVTGMLRPDAFQAICSSAGDSFYEISLLPGINFMVDTIAQAGSIQAYIEWFLQQANTGNFTHPQFITMMNLAMAPCYAPNLNKPTILGDIFFDLQTGAVLPEIWEKYLAWDPVQMVAKHEKALRSLKSIHLAAGLQDEYGMQWGHRQIAAKLSQHHIVHVLEEYPGKHGGQQWRFVKHLQLMLEKMMS